MNARTSRSIALAGAIALSAAGSLPTLAQPGGEGDVTLSLLVIEYPGPGGVEAAEDLVRLAAQASQGTITIVPTFDGQDVASAVTDGTTDLAMLPSRDWHIAGVTSLDALDAPFLIDNDALAIAVADSDIAEEAMAGLEAVGVSGLAMWPEDLRHLIAFKPSGKVFRTPADVEGATIVTAAETPGADLIEALGATVWNEGVVSGDFTGDRHSDASSGALTGMLGGLWGLGVPINDQTVVAADVTFIPKFQTLVANDRALASLSGEQRRLLDEAVSQTRAAAIGRHLSEVELGARRCAEGGTVITAGAESVALFREATQPVFDSMAADPVMGPIIAGIEALKAVTPASASAAACEAEPAPAAVTLSDATGYLGTLPPTGTFRADVTEQDLLSRGASASFSERNSAIVTWMFGDDGSYSFEGVGGVCPGTLESTDGSAVFVTEEPGHPCGLGGAFLWRQEPDGISMVLPILDGLSAQDVADLKAFFERTWTRID